MDENRWCIIIEVSGCRVEIHPSLERPDAPEENRESEPVIGQPHTKYRDTRSFYPAMFFKLMIDSRFYYSNNLKIAYVLAHVHEASISELTGISKINRRIIYDVITSNPCFISYVVKGLPSSEGGRQRIVLLSDTARKFIPEIRQLGLDLLGEEECARLRAAAEEIRRKNRNNGVAGSRENRRVNGMRSLTCVVCGKAFEAKRRDAKYCSRRCQVRAYRRMKKEREEAATREGE